MTTALSRFLSICLLFYSFASHATEYFVAPTGDDSKSGTLSEPLKTIQKAIQSLQAGDSIRLRSGIYREAANLSGKSGNAEHPITIGAYQGEAAILSGLDETRLTWKTTDKPGIFVADYQDAPFEQIFFDGKPMLEARWPNTPKDKNGDWDFFSQKLWADVDPSGNSYGTIVDADLAKTGWNVTGAKVILNVGHQYYCWTRFVEGHTAGSPQFHYPKDLGTSIQGTLLSDTAKEGPWNDDFYYLVGRKEFLDAPGEWFLDEKNKQLYIFPPDGKNPGDKPLEIKRRVYSLVAGKDANYINVEGLTFFGTAFSFGETPDKKSNHITIRNCKILYSSWTEDFSLSKGDRSEDLYSRIHADNTLVANNEFAYGALGGLFISGFDNVVENNLFHDLNYNSSLRTPPLVCGVNIPYYEGKGARNILRFNTIHRSGGILLQSGLRDTKVYLNHGYDAFMACWGGNKDTAAFYTSSPRIAGTRFTHNWIHDAYCNTRTFPWGGGIGIRGDDDTAGFTVDTNVIWNTGSVGIHMKGVLNPDATQANVIANNTVFNTCRQNDSKISIILQSKVPEENTSSSVINNIGESVAGFWGGLKLGKVKEASHNFADKQIPAKLENVPWFDFRPLPKLPTIIDAGINIPDITTRITGKGPDVGAYERGDTTYWIPGRREAKASFPIVPNGATDVPTNRDVLMWRPAYNAIAHKIYFETSEAQLNAASEKATFEGTQNVATLPLLTVNQTYYWRVDAIFADQSIVRGDTWKFTTARSSASKR
ncbi:MAG: right-handed parallel beta-helix repeat-containing protein [Verrucomicrobiota bacterium]